MLNRGYLRIWFLNVWSAIRVHVVRLSVKSPTYRAYSIDDYLTLLSTLSPYIALDSQQRDILFNDLRDALSKNLGDTIETSYLSAFHVAWKKDN